MVKGEGDASEESGEVRVAVAGGVGAAGREAPAAGATCGVPVLGPGLVAADVVGTLAVGAAACVAGWGATGAVEVEAAAEEGAVPGRSVVAASGCSVLVASGCSALALTLVVPGVAAWALEAVAGAAGFAGAVGLAAAGAGAALAAGTEDAAVAAGGAAGAMSAVAGWEWAMPRGSVAELGARDVGVRE